MQQSRPRQDCALNAKFDVNADMPVSLHCQRTNQSGCDVLSAARASRRALSRRAVGHDTAIDQALNPCRPHTVRPCSHRSPLMDALRTIPDTGFQFCSVSGPRWRKGWCSPRNA
jgi:hypothetical protein